ncbi:MAG: AraC family transcriptional regulator [Spirochaetes bacterium]|nr:AraC family transcriptional regulator [Spirochaetota bacterium]
MIEGIIYCKEDNLKNEFIEYFSDNKLIKVTLISDEKDFENLKLINSAWFIIFAVNQINELNLLKRLRKNHPHMYFYYYYPLLTIDNSQYSDFSYFNQLIVGENRTANLTLIFNQMLQSHWKKIPIENLGISYDKLSPRLKSIINYIETHEIKNCSTAKLSEYLDISQGYFSQEFKKETGQTFREFMQKLLAYYESIIFEQLDLTAKQASALLGYSELSSFSRSFKKRKGYPPSMQRNGKMKVVSRS